jgi:hypothetical protein
MPANGLTAVLDAGVGVGVVVVVVIVWVGALS